MGRYEKVLAALQVLDRDSQAKKRALATAAHWVTRFMPSDVTMIGARLGPAETCLLWLLVQQERNLARIAYSDRPELRFVPDEACHNPFLDGHLAPHNGDWTQAWHSC